MNGGDSADYRPREGVLELQVSDSISCVWGLAEHGHTLAVMDLTPSYAHDTTS